MIRIICTSRFKIKQSTVFFFFFLFHIDKTNYNNVQMNFIKKSTVYQLYNYQQCTLMAFHYFDMMFFFCDNMFHKFLQTNKKWINISNKCLYNCVHTIINDKNVALIKAL